MRIHFATLVLNLIAGLCCSQSPSVEVWDRRFGGTSPDWLNGSYLTNDRNIILIGSSKSSITGDKSQSNWDTTLGTFDYWVVKIAPEGNKLWDKRYGGNYDDWLIGIVQTPDSGFTLTGSSSSGATGDKSQPCWGGYDFWIVRIDSNGNILWDKRYGGSFMDVMFSSAPTKDGGYILGGYSNSGISGDKTQSAWGGDGGNDDYWIVKIDSIGNKQWDKRFGGFGEDILTSVLQTNDGGYLLGGTTGSGVGGDVSDTSFYNGDFWIVKTDSIGNKLWDKRYGSQGDDEFYTMISTTDGGFLLGGTSGGPPTGNKTSTGCGVPDYWIIKIDSVGSVNWENEYGGMQINNLNSIIQTSDKGYLLTGYSSSLPSCDKTEQNLSPFQDWIVKIDSIGNKQWDKTIFTINPTSNLGERGGYTQAMGDDCYLIAVTSAAGIAGYKTQNAWDSVGDYWVAKFCFSGIPENVSELSKLLSITTSPNPFTQNLNINIHVSNSKQANIGLCNMLGQTVYTSNETNLSPNYTKMLDLRYLPDGVYFVKVEMGGEILVKEVVKE